MISALAKIFEFNESSISKKKLRWITILMVLSLPLWPLMLLDYYGKLPNNWLGAVGVGMMIIGAISAICFVCTRFVNRFYFPDKYLDEWEIRIKHKSMTFAFMTLVWVLAPVVCVLSFVQNFSLNLSGEEVALWSVSVLLLLLYAQTFHALWQVRPIDE